MQGDRRRHHVAAAEPHQQTVAVGQAARQGNRDVPGLFGVPGPGARRARLVPGLAAAATSLARAPHRQLDGDVAASQGAAPLHVQRNLDRGTRLGPDERVAHALHGDGERGKVDACFVRETGAAWISCVSCETVDAWQGGRRHEPLSPARGRLTIGSPRAGCQGDGRVWSRGTDEPIIGSTMTKECPMCSEIMRVRMAERVDTIPGTQQTIKRDYREWTCPECDYFEDVEPEELLEAQ